MKVYLSFAELGRLVDALVTATNDYDDKHFKKLYKKLHKAIKAHQNKLDKQPSTESQENPNEFVSNATCEDVAKYARQRGLDNIVALVSQKHKEYVLFQDEQPIFASPSLEAIAAHIDIMSIIKRFNVEII